MLYFKKMREYHELKSANESLRRRIMQEHEYDLDLAIEIEQAFFAILTKFREGGNRNV